MDEEKYITFQEQLEGLPPEFTLFMEEYREAHFTDLIRLIDREFKIGEEFAKMPVDEQNVLMNIFKALHNFGFYGGVSYTLDPQQRYIPKFTENEAK